MYCGGKMNREVTLGLPCHEKFGPPRKWTPLVHVFRNIWTPGPDISKYLDPHGTNISGIG